MGERVRYTPDCEPTTITSPDFGSRACSTTKRVFDFVAAMFLLVIAAPVMLAAAALVRVTSSGPTLFCQTRIGQNGRSFTMFKLRTMYVDSDDGRQREFNTREILGESECVGREGIFRLDDDPRITPVGRFLRRISLDELPQLFNVLRGEMSLVGPRPSLPWEVELYTAEQRQRDDCLPGLTGLWQVSGRNRRSMQEMLALDLAYARSRSLRFDLWILLRTPYAVLFDRDTR
jgi:lipopolysaccharide/colanic/teichoic acid biosynthesis glycosyltransferase